MLNDKKIILDRIDELINKRKFELLNSFPSIHEINDGLVVRFFTDWDNCEGDEEIKYKKLTSYDKNESLVFFYLPKGSHFQLKNHFYIGDMTCLSGKMEVKFNNEIKLLENYCKISVNSDDVEGNVMDNTYILTTSNRNDWSEEILQHQKILLEPEY